jgi:hypothetical protein
MLANLLVVMFANELVAGSGVIAGGVVASATGLYCLDRRRR